MAKKMTSRTTLFTNSSDLSYEEELKVILSGLVHTNLNKTIGSITPRGGHADNMQIHPNLDLLQNFCIQEEISLENVIEAGIILSTLVRANINKSTGSSIFQRTIDNEVNNIVPNAAHIERLQNFCNTTKISLKTITQIATILDLDNNPIFRLTIDFLSDKIESSQDQQRSSYSN